MRVCRECEVPPLVASITNDPNSDEAMLAWQCAQGLSGEFAVAIRGTLGLTPERIAEIGQKEVKGWHGAEEGKFLEEHPELVQAAYNCEHRVTVLGECAVHSRPK